MPHSFATDHKAPETDHTEEVSVMVHRMERELSKLESLLDLIEASSTFHHEENGQEIITELGDIINHCTSVLEEHQTSYCTVFQKIDQLEEQQHKKMVAELLGVEFGDCKKIDGLLSRFGFLKGKVEELKVVPTLAPHCY